MIKYVSRPPRAYWDGEDWTESAPQSVVVHEPDNPPRFTGLIDHHGNELFAVTQREPIGFQLDATKPEE